ncbi:MAG: hypothetical protein ACI85Q_002119 [Salibacteraceae bacterium]|jgi:hypothetical protein
MVDVTISYPVFRKYEGDFSFFKITSAHSFIELKVMGENVTKISFTAKILPDFQFINDMVNRHNNHWIDSSESEFNKILNQAAF